MNSLLGKGFAYEIEVIKRGIVVDRFEVFNKLPTVSVEHIVGMILGNGAMPISEWYMGLFEADYVPTDATTAADLPLNAQECTAYSQTTRPLWQGEWDPVTGFITNTDNRAEFTFTQDKTVRGGFLISDPTKGGNTGLLRSITRFSSPQSVAAGVTWRVGSRIRILDVPII